MSTDKLQSKIFPKEALTQQHDKFLLWLYDKNSLKQFLPFELHDSNTFSCPHCKNELGDNNKYYPTYSDGHNCNSCKALKCGDHREYACEKYHGENCQYKDHKHERIHPIIINISSLQQLIEYSYEIEPEHPIMNNRFYVGSVDALITITVKAKHDNTTLYDKKESFFMEFKPKLDKVMDIIRQINVYREYLKGYKPILVTFDTNEQFDAILQANNIKIAHIQEQSRL